jgi:hypothetical protein
MAMIIIVPFVVPTVRLDAPEKTVTMLFDTACNSTGTMVGDLSNGLTGNEGYVVNKMVF